MTEFIVFLLLVSAIVVGLEAQHRRALRRGPEAPKAAARRPRRIGAREVNRAA
ncbi:MAG TPA: hypothetical protein VIT20_00575 [Propionibacteriaceae bacterium]